MSKGDPFGGMRIQMPPGLSKSFVEALTEFQHSKDGASSKGSQETQKSNTSRRRDRKKVPQKPIIDKYEILEEKLKQMMENERIQVHNSRIGDTYIFGTDSGSDSPLAMPEQSPEKQEISVPKK